MCQKAEARLSFSRPNPSLFWDGLSKIWLTKDALREFDRRNSNSIDHSISRPTDRPATPTSLTRRLNRHQRKRTADVFLHDCTPESLKTIKRFARNGGTDLCDLRGVCIMNSLRCVLQLTPRLQVLRSNRYQFLSIRSDCSSFTSSTQTSITSTCIIRT